MGLTLPAGIIARTAFSLLVALACALQRAPRLKRRKPLHWNWSCRSVRVAAPTPSGAPPQRCSRGSLMNRLQSRLEALKRVVDELLFHACHLYDEGREVYVQQF